MIINPKSLRINEEIRSPEVILIDGEGKKIGVVKRDDALRRAEEAELDLVEVSTNSAPPVCRIMDYGKYAYELHKKNQEAKKKQKQIEVKVVKFTPIIGAHDYNFKVEHIKEFLGEGNKVKALVFLRGRERSKPELGVKLLENVIIDIAEFGVVEKMPSHEGVTVFMTLLPKTLAGGKTNAKT